MGHGGVYLVFNSDQDQYFYSVPHISRKILNYIFSSNMCGLRCKAVSMIARGAHPPWSKRLSEAVQGILNNPQVDADVVKLLRSVCWRAELGQILKSYSVQIAMLDSILTTEYVFLNFLRYMFLQEQTHPDDGKRLQDALKGSNVSRFIERMMSDCNESNTMTIICLLTDAFVSDINSMVVFEDKEHIDERLHKLSSAESLIVRFLMKNEFYVDLYRDLCAVRKLQENYNMWITCTHLKNRKWKEQTLKEFMVRDERSLGEVYSFASALRLNRDESTQIAIKLAIDAGNSMGALTIIRLVLFNKCQVFFSCN
uniref:ERAP1_C domain-containing protein n=1 Tax=Heterorhabditis bacteriophora TaxID=37862 RepID=A0A1I7WWH1_HETBA